jgi:hypothetical protein
MNAQFREGANRRRHYSRTRVDKPHWYRLDLKSLPSVEHEAAGIKNFRACTPEDQPTIQGYLDDLDMAERALLDASLVNVQTDIDKETNAQATDLKAANTDFSKAQDALKKKISEATQ